jgi:hypothetical protein
MDVNQELLISKELLILRHGKFPAVIERNRGEFSFVPVDAKPSGEYIGLVGVVGKEPLISLDVELDIDALRFLSLAYVGHVVAAIGGAH